MSGYDSVQQKRRCVEYGRSPATGKESLVFSYMVNSNQRHLKKHSCVFQHSACP